MSKKELTSEEKEIEISKRIHQAILDGASDIQLSLVAKEIKTEFKVNMPEIKREISRIKKEIEKRSRYEEEDLRLRDLDPVFQNFVMPADYFIGRSGVVKSEYDKGGEVQFVNVVRTPVVVSGTSSNIITGFKGTQLTYIYRGTVERITVGNKVLASQQMVLELANYGIGVNAVNTKYFIEYLDEQRFANQGEIPEIKTTNKSGWNRVDGKLFFVLGAEAISPCHEERFEREVEPEFSQTFDAFNETGSYDEWVKAIKVATNYPAALAVFGAGLGGPLLEILGVQGFVFHTFGNSTAGKTTAIRAALSVWGNPKDNGGLMSNWLTTSVGAERRAELFNSLFFVLDDSSQASNDKDITSTIYMIGNQSGKVRGKPGGVRRTPQFAVLGLSSGEQPLSGTNTLMGQEVRSIETALKMFGEQSRENGEKAVYVNHTVQRNYGFKGREYIRKLVKIANDEDQLASLKERFRVIVEEYNAFSGDAYFRRTVPYYALITVGLEVFSEISLEIKLSRSKIKDAIKALIDEQKLRLNTSTNIDRRAYDYIWQRFLSSEYRFNYNCLNQGYVRDLWGKRIENNGSVEYAIFPQRLKALLEEEGFNYESCKRYFKNNGWLRLDKSNQNPNVYFNGASPRLFVFPVDKAIEEGVLDAPPEPKSFDPSSVDISTDYLI